MSNIDIKNSSLKNFGLGLRSPHRELVLESKPELGFFEVITENYFEQHQGYTDYLQDLKKSYNIITHGVSLSIGSPDELDVDYVSKVKNFIDKIDPLYVSDHLCYTGTHGVNTHDLLPVPYTKESLDNIVEKLRKLQEFYGRQIALENPSSYVEFKSSEMSEYEFLSELVERSDCLLLLDVNNIYVSAFNHGYDPKKYLDAIDSKKIAYIHLAGHTNKGSYILDTHNDFVIDEVWELYKYTIKTKGIKPTMVEWDDDIPEFDVLYNEVMKAKNFAEEVI